MKSSSGWELRGNPGRNLHRVFNGCHCTTLYFFPLPTAADQAEHSYRWRKYTNTPPPVARIAHTVIESINHAGTLPLSADAIRGACVATGVGDTSVIPLTTAGVRVGIGVASCAGVDVGLGVRVRLALV